MPTKHTTYRKRIADRLPGRTHGERQYDRRRGSSTERGYGQQWRKLRERQLSQAPLCARCLQDGLTKAASVAHHVVPLSDGGKHRLDNLRSLCRECHETVHGRA